MIKVTVELIPHGVGPPKIIGVLDIANTGDGDVITGVYDTVVYDDTYTVDKLVTGVSHYREDDVWKLIQRVLLRYDEERDCD